jgi:hypothetical protein
LPEFYFLEVFGNRQYWTYQCWVQCSNFLPDSLRGGERGHEGEPEHSESSGTKVKGNAQRLLTSRLEAVRRGETVDVRKLRYEDIRAILVADYKASGKLVGTEGDTRMAGRKGDV